MNTYLNFTKQKSTLDVCGKSLSVFRNADTSSNCYFFPTKYPKKRKRHWLFLEYLIIPWLTVERWIAPGRLRCPLGEGERRDNDCITSPLFGCKHLIMLQERVFSEAKLSVNAKLIYLLRCPVWVSNRWMSESYLNVDWTFVFLVLSFWKREILRNNKDHWISWTLLLISLLFLIEVGSVQVERQVL